MSVPPLAVFLLSSFLLACSVAPRSGSETPLPMGGFGAGAGASLGTAGQLVDPLPSTAGVGAAGAGAGGSAGAPAIDAGPEAGGSPAIDSGTEVVEAGYQDAGAMQGSFTALNYNVHGLPPLITGDDTPGRMRSIAPLLNGFDVIGLQEDFDPLNHTLLTMDALHPYQEHYDDPLPNRIYGAGLTVLSHYEITEHYAQHYVACFGELLGPGLTDCVASKGFQLTRLRMTPSADAEIDFYNTHMDAGGGDPDIQAREAQIDELIDAMAEHSEGRAIVFVADTNASDSQLQRLMQGAGLRDACDEVGCSDPARIERILVRSGELLSLTVRAWRLEPAFVDANGTGLSDHPAVAAEIAWQLVSP